MNPRGEDDSFIVPSGCAPEPCEFDRIEIGDEYDDPSGLLKPGMEVMLPCTNCGMAVNEYMAWMDSSLLELEAAIKNNQSHKNIALFHWSPSRHRKQIARFGLLPGRRPTTHSTDWRAPYICFGTDPAWSWALSGNMRWAPTGDWDLWQTWWDELKEPYILGSNEGDGIHEVRTEHRVYKRSLRYLGTRTKL